MVKVKFVGTSHGMVSNGITFIKGKEYQVDDKVAEYLVKRFKDLFEVEVKEVTKPKAKPKAVSKKDD